MIQDTLHEARVYETLLPLMKSKGVTTSPADFHRHVNVAFHSFESSVYDAIHRPMWMSLPKQFELLVDDAYRAFDPPRRMRVLDIGCGTGLSAELLLRTRFGKHVRQVDLLDTSPGMLEKCRRRASRWGVDYRLIEGATEDIPHDQYDWILTCSVLHHIPDLDRFFRDVRRLQAPSGVFFHVHDPNGDHLHDAELTARIAEFRVHQPSMPPSRFQRLLRRGRRVIPKVFRRGDYIANLNNELLRQGIIREPLLDEEVWSVTDIHDEGLPYSTGEGISMSYLAACLVDYKRLGVRSYGFFGRLVSELPRALRTRERQLIEASATNGRFVGAVWRSGD